MALKSTVQTAYLSCLINHSLSDRSQEPEHHFSSSITLTMTTAARRVHYRDRGIPRELVRRWSEQHRRRNKTIRKLETYQV
jgi:transposase-like protein